MSDWATSGTRLAYRILLRRRRKCVAARTHMLHHCKACGVHQ